MKPLPPATIIAEYQAARDALGLANVTVEYEGGWFMIYGNSKPRYRGAEIIHMTATLNERAKAKG